MNLTLQILLSSFKRQQAIITSDGTWQAQIWRMLGNVDIDVSSVEILQYVITMYTTDRTMKLQKQTI